MDFWSSWTRQRRRNVAGGLLALAIVLLLVPLVLPGGARGVGEEPTTSGPGGLVVTAPVPEATPEPTPAPTPEPTEGAAEANGEAEAEAEADAGAGPEPAGAGPTWAAERVADLPVPLEAAAVVAFQDRIWSIGGREPDAPRRALTDVFLFDPATGRWSRGPSLPQAVSHAAAVVAGDELFVVGALNSDRVALTTVLKLEVGHDGWIRWVQAPPLPVPTAGGAVAWDGRRIVYGGGMLDGQTFTGAVWALVEGRWALIGQLEQPRTDLAAASDGRGRVWFMGGRNDAVSPAQLSNVDLVTSQGVFSVVSDIMPTEGASGVLLPGVGPCLVGGRGVPDGSSRPTYLDAVQCPNVNPGITLPSLTEARAGAGTAVVRGEVYVIGGGGHGYTGSRVSEVLRPVAG